MLFFLINSQNIIESHLIVPEKEQLPPAAAEYKVIEVDSSIFSDDMLGAIFQGGEETDGVYTNIKFSPIPNNQRLWMSDGKKWIDSDPGTSNKIERFEFNRLRARMLSESDWTQLPDCPLTPEKKEEWKVWRQKLRDIPSTKRSTNTMMKELNQIIKQSP